MGLWKKQAMSDEDLTQQDEGRLPTDRPPPWWAGRRAMEQYDPIPMMTQHLENDTQDILKTHTYQEIIDLGKFYEQLHLMCMARADQIAEEAGFAKEEHPNGI